MGIYSQVIRIFISSTFSDFSNERDVLQKRVFSELSKMCRARGVEFQAVDLRWGIREDEAREQQTLDICLKEVQRCLAVSPRPNFLVLLGERYGWQPLPTTIPEKDYNAITGWLGEQKHLPQTECKTELQRWYKRDGNALPPHYRLQPKLDVEFTEWEGIEKKLRGIFHQSVIDLGWNSPRTDRYLLSATAQEITHGVLQNNSPFNSVQDHVFCFHRRRLNSKPNIGPLISGSYLDLDENDEPDQDAALRLSKLTGRLKKRLGNNFLSYQAFAVNQHNISTYHLESFSQDAREVLSTIIRGELERYSKITRLERELVRHQAFRNEKTRKFVGRNVVLKQIFNGPPNHAITVVHGPGGAGKSSVLAQAIHVAESKQWQTIFRFIGLTSESSTGLSLLHSFCDEMEHSGNENANEDFAQLSKKFRRLVMQLGAKAGSRFLIAIDALDQLPENDPARELEWLPREVPANVLLLLSTIDGVVLDGLQRRLIQVNYLEIGRLPTQYVKDLIRSWLKEEHRQLQPSQAEYILNCSKAGLPLYVRLAVEEAKLWTSFPDNPDQQGKLAADVEGIILQIFYRLSLPKNHGETIVRKTFGYLVAARYGLTESELIGVLSSDEEVMEYFRSVSPQGKNLQHLPFIVWSRLRDDIEPYLSERRADGFPAVGFFHRIFREVAEQYFLHSASVRQEFHRKLGYYFSQDEFAHNFIVNEGNTIPNRRRLSELPFHLFHSGQLSQINLLLSEAEYFMAKIESGQRYELFSEYLHCHAEMMKVEQTLEAQQLAAGLATQIIRYITDSDTTFDFEDVHAFFAFRKDITLYRLFLEEGGKQLAGSGEHTKQSLYISLLARQGNLLRRAGELEKAQNLLSEIQPKLASDGPSAELARIEYDLGYINYLRGELDLGATMIERSAETACLCGNEAGEWISRCVASYHRWQLGWHLGCDQDVAEQMLAIHEKGMEVFERHKYDNTTCERWVMNVHAARFNVAFRHNDIETAQGILHVLENDPWLKEFDDQVAVERYRGKLQFLQKDYTASARSLENIANMRRNNSFNEEGLAEDYVDAGDAYLRAGDVENATRMFTICKELPKSCGNVPWRHRAQKLSQEFENTGFKGR